MPTSVGDPTTNQRPNTPSTPQDAQIRITTGQNQLTGRPCPTTLHASRVTPTELPRVLQIEVWRLLPADTFRVMQRWPCDEFPLLRLRWPHRHLWRAPMRGCSGPRQPVCRLLGHVAPWRPATKLRSRHRGTWRVGGGLVIRMGGFISLVGAGLQDTCI